MSFPRLKIQFRSERGYVLDARKHTANCRAHTQSNDKSTDLTSIVLDTRAIRGCLGIETSAIVSYVSAESFKPVWTTIGNAPPIRSSGVLLQTMWSALAKEMF